MPVSRKSKKTKNSKTRRSSKRSNNVKCNKKKRSVVRKLRGGSSDYFRYENLELNEKYKLDDDEKIYTFIDRFITHNDRRIKKEYEENLTPEQIYYYDRYRVILTFLVLDPQTNKFYKKQVTVGVKQNLNYKLINFMPFTMDNKVFMCPECVEKLPENWEDFKHNPTCIIKDSKPYPYNSNYDYAIKEYIY
jgi:hypothetical protein